MLTSFLYFKMVNSMRLKTKAGLMVEYVYLNKIQRKLGASDMLFFSATGKVNESTNNFCKNTFLFTFALMVFSTKEHFKNMEYTSLQYGLLSLQRLHVQVITERHFQ